MVDGSNRTKAKGNDVEQRRSELGNDRKGWEFVKEERQGQV